MPIDFRSDNTHGASPEILAALERAAEGSLTSYGDDPITETLRQRCRTLFERDELEVFPVLTGTAGNALAIASMTPPWGAVFCHEDAHIQRDELGAPEFFTGGAKLVPIAGRDGKLRPQELVKAIERMAQPGCLSLTQATEAGTVYSLDELRALCDVARRSRLGVHLDGARLANALVTLGCSPADATWRAGIDVLVLGGTKNGALAAELLVVFRPKLAGEIEPRWIRGGHRLSKMRFLSAQLDAYLTDDLWLRNARHANAAAQRLVRALAGVEGIEIVRPVEANIVFVRLERPLPPQVLAYDWPPFGRDVVRLVTAFDTTDDEIDALIAAL